MKEIVDRDEPISREVWDREAAIAHFERSGRATRRRSSGLPEEGRYVYRQGEWKDLCRGPHLPSTRHSARRSSLRSSRAPTGAATRTTRSCRESTEPPGRPKRISKPISRGWKRRRSATTESSDGRWTSSTSGRGQGHAVLAPQGLDPVSDPGELCPSSNGRGRLRGAHDPPDLRPSSGRVQATRPNTTRACPSPRPPRARLRSSPEQSRPCADLHPGSVPTASSPCGSWSSAACTATSARVWCTACSACGDPPRTTPTSSARRIRSGAIRGLLRC